MRGTITKSTMNPRHAETDMASLPANKSGERIVEADAMRLL
jgi:hypothetical protein